MLFLGSNGRDHGLYLRDVDTIVFRMRTREPNSRDASDIVEFNDQPVAVSANVEHDPAIPNDISAAKYRFDIRRPPPTRTLDFGLPKCNSPVQRFLLRRPVPLFARDKRCDAVEAAQYHAAAVA